MFRRGHDQYSARVEASPLFRSDQDRVKRGFGGNQARIEFLPGRGTYQHQDDDAYWKIALAVPNIELACSQLAAAGVEVGTPHQFLDIGYLAHLQDPDGFIIEVIEHWFEGNRPPLELDESQFGGGAHLNLITLRTGKIDPIIGACEHAGMTALAVQPVAKYGFTLYFFAFTDERPPSSDLYAVENREWLYQRDYSVLEVQHVPALASTSRATPPDAGYDSLAIDGLNDSAAFAELLVRS